MPTQLQRATSAPSGLATMSQEIEHASRYYRWLHCVLSPCLGLDVDPEVVARLSARFAQLWRAPA